MDTKTALIEAAARGFAQGLVGGTNQTPAPQDATPPRRHAARRDARQLPLDLPPLPDASATVAGSDPVPEYTNGQVEAPVLTQREVEAIERTLRGETPPDTYSPDDAERKPWIGS